MASSTFAHAFSSTSKHAWHLPLLTWIELLAAGMSALHDPACLLLLLVLQLSVLQTSEESKGPGAFQMLQYIKLQVDPQVPMSCSYAMILDPGLPGVSVWASIRC